ncbi:WG repeat-containing protein [Draconibacterium orientale]|uniref:WG repeat-containing protein n=1 Tax=Draconibacterium orientale TaxID=1168034 RepID=UPI002ABD51A8|nr:WG repeat-containing protein [Draconibacterium orientale]
MKQVLLVLSVSLTLCLLQSCSTKESPAQFVQNYYRAICNGEFESLGNKLDLVSVRKEVFESYNKKVIDFFGSKAGEADIDKLAGLFEIVEIAEQIADDKKSARVNYTLKVNGDQSYNMQVALTRGDEGWKIIPKQGILNFLGYEDLLLFMPSLDNNLSDEELASFQKVPQKVDYSSCVAEAGKKGLFEEMLTRLNQKSKGTYADATVVDAEEFGCFKEGLCAFRRGNFWGFMDVDGKVVIEPRLNYPEYTFVDYDGKSIDFPFFSYGLCLVFNEGGWPIYINKKGEVVIDGSFRFMLAAPFVGNYANVGSAKLKPTNTYPLNEKRAYLTALNCYIDRNGQIKPELGISEVLGAMKAQAFVPREGLSAFRNNEALFGFWDINRKVVIPAQFTAVKSFSDGMAWVEKKDDYGRKKWGGN